MKDSPYLDIHTHRRAHLEGSVSVECLSMDELNLEVSTSQYTSAGIHPWWLEDFTSSEIEKLKVHVINMARTQKLWAIGETGIDRTIPEMIEQQKELFLWHWKLAEEYGLPLVIHNVRSGSDFLEIIKKIKPTTPWIFHDFRGNEELIASLLGLHPKCYFSFGLSIDNSQAIRDLLPVVPVGNLFLETDNQKHLDIYDIYLRASERLGMDVGFLRSQVWLNFKKVSHKTDLFN